MLRSALGVIAGYLTMALFVMATFSGVYLALGADRAFEPGTYEVSTLWLLTSFVLGSTAAILGGIVCTLVAPGSRAPVALAVLVLVRGLGLAVPALLSADGELPLERFRAAGTWTTPRRCGTRARRCGSRF